MGVKGEESVCLPCQSRPCICLSVVWMLRERGRGLESGPYSDQQQLRRLMDGHSAVQIVDCIGVIKSRIGAKVPTVEEEEDEDQSRGLALQKGRRLKGGRNDEDVELM